MAKNTSTTLEGMQRAAQGMDTCKGVADSGVNTVSAELETLKGSWLGDAGQGYHQAMQPWIDDCKFISQKLAEVRQLMHTNAGQIRQGEEENVASAQSTVNAMNLN